MTRVVKHNGKKVTWYECEDCGCVHQKRFETAHSLRPNNKFCDKDCMLAVLDMELLPYKRKRPAKWRELLTP